MSGVIKVVNATSVFSVFKLIGSDQTGNSVLESGRNPQTRKTRNCASIRDESMYNHGKNAKVRTENATETVG